jgi:hypothetical protein
MVRNAYFTRQDTSPARRSAHHKLRDPDDVSYEALERRNYLERQNRAFIEKLGAAIVNGLETAGGVLGHEHGPRLRRRS